MSICNFGYLEYVEAWDLQKSLVRGRQNKAIGDVLLLLEHPHTYTVGRRGSREHILINDAQLADMNIGVQFVDRGGEVTYHGPGQLVGYPVIHLQQWGGPLRYVRFLEDVIIAALRDYGILGQKIAGNTGVWVGTQKIAAIGLKVSQGISMHGFALNVSPDLSYFDHIVPCGMPDSQVTSMEDMLGHSVPVDEVCVCVAKYFGEAAGFTMEYRFSGILDIIGLLGDSPHRSNNVVTS